MPRDAEVPFGREAGGDVAWVDDNDFYYNHALQLALMAAEDISGESLAAADIRAAESEIQREIRDSPFFAGPVTVTVEPSDRDTFKASVSVNNINDDLELPLGEI